MKLCALLLAITGLGFAGTPAKIFTGVIHDNRCVGPNCATQCPVTKEPKYTLQTADAAWVLSDQKTPARYVGKKVVVTGTVEGGNKLKVVSIAAAR
jgi:Protein of unknown function (DUF5818)